MENTENFVEHITNLVKTVPNDQTLGTIIHQLVNETYVNNEACCGNWDNNGKCVCQK